MTNIINKLSSGWHLMRILRVGIGIAAAIEAITLHDYAIGAISVFFLYQGITDTGCCSAAGCVVPPPRSKKKETEDISYEEIK